MRQQDLRIWSRVEKGEGVSISAFSVILRVFEDLGRPSWEVPEMLCQSNNGCAPAVSMLLPLRLPATCRHTSYMQFSSSWAIQGSGHCNQLQLDRTTYSCGKLTRQMDGQIYTAMSANSMDALVVALIRCGTALHLTTS